MTFSSRWLLAFRVGGATVALLTHCPACHVVFNHSSWLIQTSCTPPHVQPLSSSWCSLKWQRRLKATKPEKIHFYFPLILFPAAAPPQKPLSSSLGVKLDLGSVKCWRVWPSPGVACHIQLWAPNRKALAHLSLFSHNSTGAGIKHTSC